MNDETMTGMEQQTPDQGDAFLAGWDETAETEETGADQPGTDGTATEDSGATGAETPVAAVQEQGTPTGADAQSGEAQATQKEGTEAQKGAAPTAWNIKHLDTTETITADDPRVPTLLQKGLDYDRIREKYDEAQPLMQLFNDFASKANMTVSDYVKLVRSEAKKASGMSEAEARRAVELEDREAAVAAKEAAEQAARTQAENRRADTKRDLDDFAAAFPEVFAQAKADPKTIPQSVWDQVNAGMSLTAAYSRYAVAQAQAEAKTAQAQAETAGQNAVNAERTTGSMKTAGQENKKKDPFLDGFGG